MIVSSNHNVVNLYGSLRRNEWLTIKAAANLLLRDHPNGIIINCSDLTEVSEEGTRTFLEAVRYIEGAGARIVVCALPDAVMEVIRTVPGVRSQLPISRTVEEGRASLARGTGSPRPDSEGQAAGKSIVIPLLPGLDVAHALAIAGRVGRDKSVGIHLVALVEVQRNLPLNAPLPDVEQTAQSMLVAALQVARTASVPVQSHMERVRDRDEGLLGLLKVYSAGHVIIAAPADMVDDEAFHTLVHTLLRRAPCGVLIGRRAIPACDLPKA